MVVPEGDADVGDDEHGAVDIIAVVSAVESGNDDEDDSGNCGDSGLDNGGGGGGGTLLVVATSGELPLLDAVSASTDVGAVVAAVVGFVVDDVALVVRLLGPVIRVIRPSLSSLSWLCRNTR